ncbi:hypothetical protein Tco_0366774 [Tanacetum coccineum]
MLKLWCTHRLSTPSTILNECGQVKSRIVVSKHFRRDDRRKIVALMDRKRELRVQCLRELFIYKETEKKLHDSQIKNRFSSNMVIKSPSFHSRLKFSPESSSPVVGPFTINESVSVYGTCQVGSCAGMVLISKSTATVSSTTMEGIHHHWLSRTSRLSLRTTEFRDRVELATRINPTFQESSRVRCLIPKHSSFSSFV